MQKAEHQWHWTFDLAEWPHRSFLGRRWTDLHGGNIVIPKNGCLYWWGAVLGTILWMLKRLYGAIEVPYHIGFGTSTYKEPEPSRTLSFIAALLTGVTKGIVAGLHALFLGKYSPFRLIGRWELSAA